MTPSDLSCDPLEGTQTSGVNLTSVYRLKLYLHLSNSASTSFNNEMLYFWHLFIK